MKVETKKAYINKRCMECGNPINDEMIVRSPEKTKNRKWKLCKKCDNIIFTKKA